MATLKVEKVEGVLRAVPMPDKRAKKKGGVKKGGKSGKGNKR